MPTGRVVAVAAGVCWALLLATYGLIHASYDGGLVFLIGLALFGTFALLVVLEAPSGGRGRTRVGTWVVVALLWVAAVLGVLTVSPFLAPAALLATTFAAIPPRRG